MTKSGIYYENAMKHVEKLGLLQSIETSSANQLGDAIRAHLRRVHQVDQIGNDAMEISDDGDGRLRSEDEVTGDEGGGM